MSTQTPNLNLDLREAADIFNPLSTNSNFETLDTVIGNIQKKGGIVTYTTTASANLLKLSDNPTPNETVFKFVAAGDANTWSYQETVNKIVALNGEQKTVKAGEMYVAWVNAANSMVVIAWPDVVNAQTFDGKGPAEWATKVQLDAVNQTAANATTTAQAAATVANNALEAANDAIQTTAEFGTYADSVQLINLKFNYTKNFVEMNGLYMEKATVQQGRTIYSTSNIVYHVIGTTSGNVLGLPVCAFMNAVSADKKAAITGMQFDAVDNSTHTFTDDVFAVAYDSTYNVTVIMRAGSRSGGVTYRPTSAAKMRTSSTL